MQNSGEDKEVNYDFQNGAGDTSGNGYDGTIQADSGAAAVLTETGGKNNGAALELTRGSNGAGGYVELPVAALTAITGDWSMNLWVKLTDNPTWNHIFAMGTDQSHYLVISTKGNPGGHDVGVTMGLNSGSGEYRVATDASQVPSVGAWNMLTFSQSGNQVSIYLNGKPLAVTYHNQNMSATYEGCAVSWADVAAVEGVSAHVGNTMIFPDPGMDGLLGEVALYSAAMDADAVAARFAAEKAAYGLADEGQHLPTPSDSARLLMHYDFTGDAGTTIEDKANDYDGTLGSDSGGEAVLKAGEGSMAPDKVPNLDYADQLVSHCGLISVTQKEIDRLVEYWGVTSVEKGIFFTVLDAENPEAVTVTVGTAAEDLELPQTVRVQYDDGGWRDVTVAWDTTSYQPTEGTYTLTGAITLAEDVKNPDGAVTRAMVWTVLARMAGEDTDGGATWYSKAQIWAMETGVSDGTKPMESITGEQLAAMLYRFEGSPKVSGNLSAYPDGNTVSDWAADAMVWATETGLINGINGYLKPQSGATRAQLATMLMRFTA